MRLAVNIDARSEERIRLLAIQLAGFQERLDAKLGNKHELSEELRALRARFMADLNRDRFEGEEGQPA